MKKGLRILLAALALYLLLLLLLLAAEAPAPGASIRSFGDALWFSLITMTTVGYGDLAPVTSGGRILGVIFALGSLGVLTAMIGLGLRLIGGRAIPRLRLRLNRGQRWYVFQSEDPVSLALVKDLRKRKDGGLFVFPAGKGAASGDLIRLDADPEDLLRLRGGHSDGLLLFYLGEDPWKNYAAALSAAKTGLREYCLAEPADRPDAPELSFFSPREALARLYWQEHPLRREETRLVLIGCGETGSALLERALLVNVFEPERKLEYHVFEDTVGFSALHPCLTEALRADGGGDRLVFHEEDWQSSLPLLAQADRILLCREFDSDDLALYQQLKTWFPLDGQIHLRLREPLPGLPSFGALERVITAEAVMHEELDRRARTVNDIYNEGAAHPVPWSALSPFLRQANIAAADHLPVKARLLLGDDSLTEPTEGQFALAYERYRELLPRRRDEFQEIEHRRWLRFYQMYNWTYAPVRDNARRRHPLMLPYDALSEEERRKDAYAWELLGRIGSERQPHGEASRP